MKSKIIIAAAGTLALASLLAAIPALAQTTTDRIKESSTTRQELLQARQASTSAAQVARLQNRGNQQIENRISDLNKILARIGEMKKVSDSDKTSFTGAIQDEITTLNNLDSEIASGTVASTTKAEVQSITKAYRVYALIAPRLNIAAAADRISTTADMLTAIAGKLEARLASSTNLAGSSTLQADLSDMTAKIADAQTQAKAATDEVTALQPDNGVPSVMQSNTTALKDARTKIKTAQKDLITARQDAQTIVNALKGK